VVVCKKCGDNIVQDGEPINKNPCTNTCAIDLCSKDQSFETLQGPQLNVLPPLPSTCQNHPCAHTQGMGSPCLLFRNGPISAHGQVSPKAAPFGASSVPYGAPIPYPHHGIPCQVPMIPLGAPQYYPMKPVAPIVGPHPHLAPLPEEFGPRQHGPHPNTFKARSKVPMALGKDHSDYACGLYDENGPKVPAPPQKLRRSKHQTLFTNAAGLVAKDGWKGYGYHVYTSDMN